MRVAWALALHELSERLRDRWVAVTTVLFALLAAGLTAYGTSAGDGAVDTTAPSLATLAAFLVPLVALVLGHDAIVAERERHTLGMLLALPISRFEVLAAKYAGRGAALLVAIGLGLGASALLLGPGQRAVLLTLLPPTGLLGAAFLSIGVLVSAVAHRHTTAASLAVAIWFLFVFFYDLGLLALLVATDGAVGQDTVSWLVVLNPAGLYRSALLADLVGEAALADLGLAVALPSPGVQAALWTGWILGPLAAGGLALYLPRAVTA